jgi:hypothetical protein
MELEHCQNLIVGTGVAGKVLSWKIDIEPVFLGNGRTAIVNLLVDLSARLSGQFAVSRWVEKLKSRCSEQDEK